MKLQTITISTTLLAVTLASQTAEGFVATGLQHTQKTLRSRHHAQLHRQLFVGIGSDGRRLWSSLGKAFESAGKSIGHAATSLTKKSTWDSAGKAISSAAKTVAKTATTVADGAVKGAEDVVTVPLAGAAALAKVAGAK